MILAAGMGTRLRPITDNIPKALVQIAGKPLLHHLIERLILHGFTDLIINIHHMADQIVDFVKSNDFSPARITFSDERRRLLDTGGALKKASWFLDSVNPFLVHNCDVVSTFDLENMLNQHINSKSLSTLAVSSRNTSRPLAFCNGLFKGRWNDTHSADSKCIPYAFSGVSVFEPEIFDLMPNTDTFSLIDMLADIANNRNIRAFVHQAGQWADAGSTQRLTEAELLLKQYVKNHDK